MACSVEEKVSNDFSVGVYLVHKSRSHPVTVMFLCLLCRRYGVSFRCSTNAAQTVPAEFQELLFNFRRDILNVRRDNHVAPGNIFNMDQTMVRFDMPSSRTNAKKGSKTVRIKTTKAEKKGFTVALAASASGEKLPAVVIFKERGGVLGARVQRQLHVPNNVRVFASANGWMTRELYERWLRGTFDTTRSMHAYVHAYRNKLKAKHSTVHKYNTVLCKHISIRINVITSHSLSCD